MLRIKDKNTVPPGGYRFTEPTTRCVLTASTMDGLIRAVCGYRKANGYGQSTDTRGEIEQQMCESFDPHTRAFNCRDSEYPAPLTAVGWQHVASFIKVLAKFVTDRPEFVPQEEAERRAEICLVCPYNVPLAGCGVCRAGIEEAMGFLGGRETSRDAGLRACGVCGCSNRAQVHIPLDVLRAGVRGDAKFPPNCWKGVKESADPRATV